MLKHWLRLKEWIPWLTAALVVLSGNWAASAISDSLCLIFGGEQIKPSGLRILYIGVFFISVILFIRQRKNLFPPHTRYLAGEAMEKKKHLVLSLSNLATDLAAKGGIPAELQLKHKNLKEDIDIITAYKTTTASNVKWTWEMPFRAILHHAETPRVLESVTVICSRKTNDSDGAVGSIDQLHLFYDIFRKYGELSAVPLRLLAKKSDHFTLVEITSKETISSYEGLDFEDFDELSQALWVLLSEFKDRKIRETDVAIDITGGQKPTSIVGAAITFSRKIKAQYVQTNRPWGVISYDVIQATSDTGGLGL